MKMEVEVQYREEIVAEPNRLAQTMRIIPTFKGAKFTKQDIDSCSDMIVAAMGKRKLAKLQKGLRMGVKIG